MPFICSVIQFFIRLGCSDFSPYRDVTAPVHVQYSTNAGITWYTLRTLNFDTDYGVTQYVVLDVPEAARTNETRVRWRQVSDDGAYLEDWALDQVCQAFCGYIKYCCVTSTWKRLARTSVINCYFVSHPLIVYSSSAC